MTAEKIIFFQTFPTGSFQNQKLGIEITVNPSDSIKEAFEYAKNELNECFNAMNQQPDMQEFEPFVGKSMPHPSYPPTQIQETQTDRTIGLFIEDIQSCKDLLTLNSYKFVVKGKPDLQAAFDKRLNELQK